MENKNVVIEGKVENLRRSDRASSANEVAELEDRGLLQVGNWVTICGMDGSLELNGKLAKIFDEKRQTDALIGVKVTEYDGTCSAQVWLDRCNIMGNFCPRCHHHIASTNMCGVCDFGKIGGNLGVPVDLAEKVGKKRGGKRMRGKKCAEPDEESEFVCKNLDVPAQGVNAGVKLQRVPTDSEFQDCLSIASSFVELDDGA